MRTSVVNDSPAGLSASTSGPASPGRDRSKIPAQYLWDLSHLFASDEAWRREKEAVAHEIPSLPSCSGTLGSSPAALLRCLDLMADLSRRLSILHSYASMASDQDTRVAGYLAMQQEVQQTATEFAAAAAFIEPEILALDRNVVERFLGAEPRLTPYRFYLTDILRRKEHTGTASEEKIIADAGLMASAPQDIYGIFANADFPYPDVQLSTGASVRIDAAAFSLHRASPVREDRATVMASFFGKLRQFRRTFGTQLFAEVRKNMFTMRARRYPSCLHAALDANNIPAEVYHALVRNVRANLPSFHRYLRLRQRILAVDRLYYYDLYAPLLAEVDLTYTVEDAEEHILRSLAPLGEEYRAVARRAFTERWVDMFPTDGKRSGAYSNGSAYGIHPYMLMNYHGRYDDMSTLTHELGHTMHSYRSNAAQPWITSQYSIFVAEVASTFNEALLLEQLLGEIDDDATRLSLLGHALEGIKGTVFRQTQFAEFELAIHEKAERGEALTGEAFDALYGALVRGYYGHEAGVCTIMDEVESEWAYIPHFYYNFYVYQYATAFTASQALVERVLGGDRTATERYLAFLSSGGSDYPINQLRSAGVDMTSPEPFTLTMRRMNRIMDEIEQILARLGR